MTCLKDCTECYRCYITLRFFVYFIFYVKISKACDIRGLYVRWTVVKKITPSHLEKTAPSETFQLGCFSGPKLQNQKHSARAVFKTDITYVTCEVDWSVVHLKILHLKFLSCTAGCAVACIPHSAATSVCTRSIVCGFEIC